jgi:extracellular elastinolytic metalloproteinase
MIVIGIDFDVHLYKQYTVLPITKETLLEGLETLTNPQDTLASPSGWHTVGTTSTTTTA